MAGIVNDAAVRAAATGAAGGDDVTCVVGVCDILIVWIRGHTILLICNGSLANTVQVVPTNLSDD